MKNNFSAIVLAAGVGRRMKSEKSKVLHTIAGEPMIRKTVNALQALAPAQVIIVANKNNYSELKSILPKTEIAIQQYPKGTADAVKTGLNLVKKSVSNIAVIYGDDTAFYKPQTIENIFTKHTIQNADITFVTFKKENPGGLGRIIRKNGKLSAIVEEKDATDSQKKIKEVNDGLYFFDKLYLNKLFKKLSPSKATGELYITDTIELALKNGGRVETYLLENSNEWHGVNTQVELALANLKVNKRIHFMGISGSGATAVAGIAKAQNYDVSGCDINPNDQYSSIKNILILSGHSEEHIKDIDCLIVSPAVIKQDPENIEIKKAKEIGLPVLTWQEFQGSVLMNNKFTIAVAGAYGKSTTTAMIGKILTDLNLDPTVEVGAKVLDWKSNYRIGKSKYYVCEADEYNDNFLNYQADIAVVLNIGWDHPDYFKDRESAENSFLSFTNNIKIRGSLITTKEVSRTLKGKIRKDIKIVYPEAYTDLNLKIIGNFRMENARVAITISKLLNIDVKKSKQSVENFKGVGRRLEPKGNINGVKFYDDYAVQPYTINKTANALKKEFPNNKVTLILEPHTFSRVNKFFDKFALSLKSTKIDQIFITDVFGAREMGNKSELSKKLANACGAKVKYIGDIKEASKFIKNNIKSFEVICTMGAGDAYKIFDLVKNG